uniref:Mediator of RNA polymerase II transcription subunit 23 n=1 Tax=Glossina austeni TaxID=7395 RepID=A0A1A9UDH4_GLOAU
MWSALLTQHIDGKASIVTYTALLTLQLIQGNLPYEPDLVEEESQLLHYVLEQTYSKKMVCIMLNLQKQRKQRCNTLEKQLASLITNEMTEPTDNAGSDFNAPDEQI